MSEPRRVAFPARAGAAACLLFASSALLVLL